MGLAQKLAIRITALVVALVLVGGASLWGLAGLIEHFDAAGDEYEQLREVYEIGHRAALAKTLIHIAGDHRRAIDRSLRDAIDKTEGLLSNDGSRRRRLDEAYRPVVASIATQLRRAYDQARRGAPTGADLRLIDTALGHVAALAGRIKSRIILNRNTAAWHVRVTILVLAILTAATIAAATVIGVSQYRGVMRPLRRLEQGVERVARADFAERLPITDDREFSRLAVRFNYMAEELDGLYRRLEEQVEVRSRQLVRSERLAGVGYLAAGLAHEINNPLGIISGYAEASLQRINENGGGGGPDAPTARALNVICEETFRCKEITSKLLHLACPGAEERRCVSVTGVIKRVVEMMGGLPRFRDRRLVLSVDDESDPSIQANEVEVNQVMINLIGNALEAVGPDTGRVNVAVSRRGRWVTIRVKDNGRGMTPEAKRRVFDPFFTDKPRHDQRGIGLGLFVTHAIVQRHGGRIHVDSEGPGQGSEFVVELPAVMAEVPAHV